MNGSNSNTTGGTFATVAAATKRESDCIGDAMLQEIARRLQVTIERQDSDIIGSVDAPADKTKIWWATDPTTGVRLGQPKVWDVTAEAWVALGNITLPAQAKPRKRRGELFLAAGSGAQVISFESVGTPNFEFRGTMERRAGASWIAASANMTGFGWQVLGKTQTSVTVHFFAVPTDGLTIAWTVETFEDFTN